MGFYDIGEPRGNDQHPGSPDYDDRLGDLIGDECIAGTLCLKHCPANLLRALADFCTDMDNDAIRELLAPLYAGKSAELAKLREEFSRSDVASDVAAMAIEWEHAA